MPAYYWMYDFGYLLYILPFVLFAAFAQFKIKSSYSKYSRIKNSTGLTGAEVARQILDNNELYHVKIKHVKGQLSDHYDPRTQTVALSDGIYDSTSVSAASVAAHEVGHAIQHAKGYVPLKIRSTIAPVVALSSNFVWILIMLGFVFKNPSLVNIGVIFFAGAVVFQLITLPVEFDASSRAIKQLRQYNLVSESEISGSKSVLSAAALTYVAATLVAVAQLARLLMMTQGSRSRD